MFDLPLPLHLLKTLVVFSKTGNVSLTAKTLGLTQPAISLQLKQIQELSNPPVLQRKAQSLELTNYGKQVANAIEPIFDHLYEEVRRLTLFYGDPKNGEIRIGCRKELFGEITHFVNFPGKVSFFDLKSADTVIALLKNDIDIAISHERPDVHHIKCRELFSQRTRLIAHKKWFKKSHIQSNATKKEHPAVNLDFITNTPMIVFNQNAGFIKEWLEHLNLNQKKLFIKAEVQDWGTINTLVSEGHGFALIPTGVESPKGSVEELLIPEEIIPSRKFYLLYSNAIESHPIIKKLIQEQANKSH